jgi:cytochrome c peroxidase
MKRKQLLPVVLVLILLGLFVNSCTKDPVLSDTEKGDVILKSSGLTAEQNLGKLIFFDENLSANQNMSCASCHDPSVGFTGPDANINLHGAVYEGSTPGRFGDRKPPSAAYGGNSPLLYFDGADTWTGGMFWDGRATGWRLGDPLAEQAQGPFLNPMEHDLASPAEVIEIISNSGYASLFEEVYGAGSLNGNVMMAYDNVGRAIAAYERSFEVSSFTSKYDYWLNGQAKLTAQEKNGRALFQGKAKCAKCHPIKGNQPLFTDFTFDNLGIPMNPENPYALSHPGWTDPGLGGFLNSIGDPTASTNIGKHKVPSLRNVDMRPYPGFVKAYGHNGYFKSLEEIVHFYNTRDVAGAGWNGNPWPAPEVTANMNTSELGNLKLSTEEEAAIVTFLATLSDGYTPE